ncbi:MAG TPA: hypothetical protein VGC13_02680 [Longimicrobium sp.]|jgi:hypothetical protein|uniref:hypothetical protein n=1 Tax=Longimicrobium sp. TaxID=2029185 RepID=UPI002ED8AD76
MIATSQMLTASVQARSAFLHASGHPALRQTLDADELVQAINHLLAARPECNGLAFEAGRLAPAQPDSDGCNWRPEGLRLKVERGPSTRALAGVRQAVDLARLCYYLTDPQMGG